MKILTKYGGGFIKSPPRFGTGRLFVPFPRHPLGEFGLRFDDCASGAVIIFFEWSLSGFIYFYYPTLFCSTDVEAVAFLESYQTFQSANGYVGYFGEWYNAQVRGIAFDKVSPVNWSTWLLEH